ncbi:hypothetical protein JB92DRAFT_2990442 [Gautieria morchelliformis]|nr:hypothetical protein JB92DRAFT_2990442 [Gautieria morchelliformis]
MSQNIKDKDISNKSATNNTRTEQQFTILPHPAKTNDPRDLEPPQPGAGLTSKPEIAAHHAHGPQILKEDIVNSLEKPISREELRKRAEELNK